MTFVDSTAFQGRRNGHIKLHSADAFAGMRKAGQLTARCLDELVPRVKPGVTTAALDRFVFEFGRDHDAYPAPLNYRGYRKAICTSINHVVCHGIPDDKPLRDGDIQPEARLGDIGHAIQSYAEAERCSVVRDFCGHGLGRLFHDEPNILHAGKRGEGPPMKPGMFFTIEPMINLGGAAVKVLSDGWTAVTRDRSLSAQFEHTVAVTDTGVEVFTLSPAGLDRPPLFS
jgi:methionyl aminopeptidase